MIPSQHRAGKVTALSRALVGVSVLALFMAVVEPAEAHPSGGPKYTDNHGSDTFYWPGASYNGHKIYLSPAHHWTGYK